MFLQRFSPLPTWTTGFGSLATARRDMERLFETLSGAEAARSAGVFPAINVTEDADAIHVRAELAGFKRDDLEITIENDTLTLAGERQMPADTESVSFHRRERQLGRFSRALTLPVRVDAQQIEARYRDGVLVVTLPKAAEAKPKQITVQADA